MIRHFTLKIFNLLKPYVSQKGRFPPLFGCHGAKWALALLDQKDSFPEDWAQTCTMFYLEACA